MPFPKMETTRGRSDLGGRRAMVKPAGQSCFRCMYLEALLAIGVRVSSGRQDGEESLALPVYISESPRGPREKPQH